jgi:hypothetical protein
MVAGQTDSRTVVGSVLLARDQSLGVEQATVSTGANLIDHIGLQVDLYHGSATSNLSCSSTHVEGTGNVLSSSSLGEEGGEAIVVGGGRVLHETTIGLERSAKSTVSRAKTVTVMPSSAACNDFDTHPDGPCGILFRQLTLSPCSMV